jgi:hypothetical protein
MKLTHIRLFHAAVLAFALSASGCQMLQSLMGGGGAGGLMGMLGPLLGGGAAPGLVDESDEGSAMSLTGGGSSSGLSRMATGGYNLQADLAPEDSGKLYGMYSSR